VRLQTSAFADVAHTPATAAAAAESKLSAKCYTHLVRVFLIISSAFCTPVLTALAYYVRALYVFLPCLIVKAKAKD